MNTINKIINEHQAALELSKADSKLLKELQAKLKELNYYSSDIDGIYGQRTATAWAFFKSDYHQSNPLLIGEGSLKILLTANPRNAVIPPQAIELIKEFEGYSDHAYGDDIWGWECPTIGWGTIKYPDGSRVTQNDTCNKAQAQEWLEWEVNSVCKHKLEQIPTWSQMNQNQRAAIYSFAYNLGAGFYGSSGFDSITALLKDSSRWTKHEDVITVFTKYINPRTPAEEGLRRRREAEANLFLS